MPSVYNGLPGDISFPAAVTISSSTNTNPITVNTSAPHGLLTGDRAHIYDHAVNTAANGINTITKTGGSSFTIPVAGNGVGVATGSVQPLTYGAATNIPSDATDARNAASVNVPFECALDRSAVILPATGGMKLAAQIVLVHTDIAGGNWAHIAAAALTAGTPAQMVSDGTSWSILSAVGGVEFVVPSTGGIAPLFGVSGAVVGDNIMCRLDTTAASDTSGRLLLYCTTQVPPQATPTWPGGYIISASYGVNAIQVPVSAYGNFNAGAGGGNIYVQPAWYPLSTATQSVQLKGDSYMTIQVWRTTGVPQ